MDNLESELERLELPQDRNSGVMKYDNTRFHYSLISKSVATREHPAKWRLTPDSHGGGKSLSIFVWEDAPREYAETLIVHELKEAQFYLRDDHEMSEAHKMAVPHHMAYAKKFMDAETHEGFLEWQKQFSTYEDF